MPKEVRMARKSKPAPFHGLVLLDKPEGITSHDLVGKLRKLLQTKTIGHAGTLDPMATGLMVLLVGLWPAPLIDMMHPSINSLVEHLSRSKL